MSNKKMTVLLVSAGWLGGVHAGGTGFDGYSVSGLGNAGAGQAVLSSDPSALYSNPALLTRFKRTEATIGGVVALEDNSYQSLRDNDGAPTRAGTTGQNGQVFDRRSGYDGGAVAPNVFMAVPLDSQSAVGFGVSGSHALLAKYDPNHPGRSQGQDVQFQVSRVNLGYARKLSPTFSVGMNGSYERLYLKAKIAVNYRNAATRLTDSQALVDVLDAAVVDIPEETSAILRMYGWAFNAQVGALWEPTTKTSVGISFRPKTPFNNNKARLVIQEDAEGENLRSFLASPLTAPVVGLVGVNGPEISEDLGPSQGIRNNITLPYELRFSVLHHLAPRWDLMMSYTRQDFRTTQVRFERQTSGRVLLDGAQRLNVTESLRLGVHYTPFKRLTLRAGLAYENGAVSDDSRIPLLPDNDRRTAGVGANIRLSPDSSIDLGWMRINIKPGLVGLNTENIEPNYVRGGEYFGKTRVTADFFGIALNEKF